MPKHLTNRQKKKLVADYADCGSYSAVAKKHKVSVNTVKNAVLADEDFANVCKEKKGEVEKDLLAWLEGRGEPFKELWELAEIRSAELIPKAGDIQRLWTGLAIASDKITKGVDTRLKEREVALKEAAHEAEHGYAETATAYAGLPADAIGRAYIDINRDINALKYAQYDFRGGRGSLKSSFIALKVVDRIMLNPKWCALAVRALQDDLRRSVYNQIVWAIDYLNLTHLFKCNVSPMEITRKDTGQKIYFMSAEAGKIKSIKPPNGMHIAIVWCEEADQIVSNDVLRNIKQSAFRGGDEGLLFRSYNTPISAAHYINVDALTQNDRRVIHHSYYTDAPPEWLGQAFFDEAEHLKETSERAYRHEYLGEATGTGANVFENVVVREITDDEIRRFDRVYYGLDWGWYPDPKHFAGMAFEPAQRRLYIFKEWRANKTSNADAAEILHEYKNARITADSAGPEHIADFHKWGFDMRGAEKGPKSREYSYQWLQSLDEIIVDPRRCPHTADEFLTAEYERNKDGDIISGYPETRDHAIDAVRYALENIWKRRGK